MSRRNDADREQWIANDEGLYDWARRWMRSNKGGMRGFIKANRAEIDAAIDPVIDGTKRPHHLKYG